MVVLFSLIILVLILFAGLRIPGILIAGGLFTYQLSALTDLGWVGLAYVLLSCFIILLRYISFQHRLTPSSIDVILFLFVILSISSVIWSMDPALTAAESLALATSVGGFYGMARLMAPDKGRSVRAMLWCMAVVSALLSLLLLAMRDLGDGIIAKTRLLVEKSDASAVGLSQPFAPCLLACSILLLMTGPIWRKSIALAALGITGYAAVASGTRSVFLGFGAGLAVYLLLGIRTIRPAQMLQAFALLGGSLSIWFYTAPIEALNGSIGRLVSTLGEASLDKSSLQRLELYRLAWDLFLDNPILGIGDGGIGRYSEHAYPHNVVLEVLSEFGLVGAGLLAAFLIVVLREAIYLRRFEPDTSAILLAMLTVAIVQHQVSFSFAMARTLFLMAGLLAAYGGIYRSREAMGFDGSGRAVRLE